MSLEISDSRPWAFYPKIGTLDIDIKQLFKYFFIKQIWPVVGSQTEWKSERLKQQREMRSIT
jgi:hypothetical protein